MRKYVLFLRIIKRALLIYLEEIEDIKTYRQVVHVRHHLPLYTKLGFVLAYLQGES